jgi:ribosome-binding protein aMBF1 (putative translation factor)
VDTITNSKIANLKELRPGSRGRSEIRILFVFDPWRSAILLIAGDKAGNWTKWYARMDDPSCRTALRDLSEGTGSGGRQQVTSYTKWDRDAYIERVGGPEEAERRRKTLMARQSGQRLAEERKQRGLTQAQLAETMGVSPGRVSQIERGELSTIEAIARYVQALGGHLELVANFADHSLTVTTTEAA